MKEKKLYNEHLLQQLWFYKNQLKKLNKCLSYDCSYDFIYSDTLIAIDKKNKKDITLFQIPKKLRNTLLISRCVRGRVIQYVKKQNNNEYVVYVKFTSNPIIILISLKDYFTEKIETLEEMVNYDKKN